MTGLLDSRVGMCQEGYAWICCLLFVQDSRPALLLHMKLNIMKITHKFIVRKRTQAEGATQAAVL